MTKYTTNPNKSETGKDTTFSSKEKMYEEDIAVNNFATKTRAASS